MVNAVDSKPTDASLESSSLSSGTTQNNEAHAKRVPSMFFVGGET